MHKPNPSITGPNKTLKQAKPVCNVIHTGTQRYTKNGMPFAGKIYKMLENPFYTNIEQEFAPKKTSNRDWRTKVNPEFGLGPR